MPNHQQSIAVFVCKEDKEAEFNEMCSYLLSSKEDGKVYPMDFRLLIPYPENMYVENIGLEKEQELDAAGIPRWNKWQPENWGTKWNLYESTVVKHDEDYRLSISFQTAWDFPLPIAEEIVRRYSHCAEITFFTACEGGWDAGIYYVENEALVYTDLKPHCDALRVVLACAQPEK